jgi:hypothetical protein
MRNCTSQILWQHIKITENTHFTSNAHFLRPPSPATPRPFLAALSVGTFGIPYDFLKLRIASKMMLTVKR